MCAHELALWPPACPTLTLWISLRISQYRSAPRRRPRTCMAHVLHDYVGAGVAVDFVAHVAASVGVAVSRQKLYDAHSSRACWCRCSRGFGFESRCTPSASRRRARTCTAHGLHEHVGADVAVDFVAHRVAFAGVAVSRHRVYCACSPRTCWCRCSCGIRHGSRYIGWRRCIAPEMYGARSPSPCFSVCVARSMNRSEVVPYLFAQFGCCFRGPQVRLPGHNAPTPQSHGRASNIGSPGALFCCVSFHFFWVRVRLPGRVPGPM